MKELSVVVAVEEASDVIVVFTMEKLLNIYFEKDPKCFAIKKRNCAQEWIGNIGLLRAGENLLYLVFVGKK